MVKVNSRIGAVWAIAVFVVIGLLLILVAALNGGDDNDQETQPDSIVGFVDAPGAERVV